MPNATPQDAEIVLRLYELRREEVMRKARKFVTFEFWPHNVDELIQLTSAVDTEHNAYLRQVISFMEMAVSLPLHGAVHSDLFADWNAEIIFNYAKFKPFLDEFRKKTNNPGFLGNVERFVNSSKTYQERLEKALVRTAKLAEAAHAK